MYATRMYWNFFPPPSSFRMPRNLLVLFRHRLRWFLFRLLWMKGPFRVLGRGGVGLSDSQKGGRNVIRRLPPPPLLVYFFGGNNLSLIPRISPFFSSFCSLTLPVEPTREFDGGKDMEKASGPFRHAEWPRIRKKFLV